MSKIKMNATTYDFVSALKMDDIKMLEAIHSPALAIRDKDGNCIFKLMTGTSDATCESGVQFSKKDMNGYAVMTFPMDTAKPADQIRESIYRKVGGIKKYLDQIEVSCAAAVAEETARKNAFIAALTDGTAPTGDVNTTTNDGDTAFTAPVNN